MEGWIVPGALCVIRDTWLGSVARKVSGEEMCQLRGAW